jgi:predicted signal transduction protein with EAL and GGDEF domain
MDQFTLVVACALAAAIMAISMGMLYLTGSRQRCLLDWSGAGTSFAISSTCAACVFKLGPGHILLSSIGNALYIVGHFGILAGLRRQLGLGAGWNWIAAAGVLVARLACMPLIVLELFFSLELVTRASYVVFGASLPSFVGSQFLQTSGSLFVLVFLSVATMSCAQVVMHQQALALRRASMTDVLTGWLNRRALIDIAAREFARCRRGGKSLYVLVFDIDHFKAVNDRHGHAVGDEALSHVTALAAGVLRGCDARCCSTRPTRCRRARSPNACANRSTRIRCAPAAASCR